MQTATKEFHWEMAHMLENHNGLCKNVHGHSYKMQVTIGRNDGKVITDDDELAAEGMVMDFSKIKNVVNRLFVDKLDHAFVFNSNSDSPAVHEILEILLKYHMKVFGFPFRTTAENMAEYIGKTLQAEFLGSMYSVLKIRLYETVTGFAEWKPDLYIKFAGPDLHGNIEAKL